MLRLTSIQTKPKWSRCKTIKVEVLAFLGTSFKMALKMLPYIKNCWSNNGFMDNKGMLLKNITHKNNMSDNLSL